MRCPHNVLCAKCVPIATYQQAVEGLEEAIELIERIKNAATIIKAERDEARQALSALGGQAS